MLTRDYPILGSSANPDNISLTIKSIGVWLVPAVIAIGSMFSIEFEQADLTQAVNTMAVIVAGSLTVYGLGRKLYYQINK